MPSGLFGDHPTTIERNEGTGGCSTTLDGTVTLNHHATSTLSTACRDQFLKVQFKCEFSRDTKPGLQKTLSLKITSELQCFKKSCFLRTGRMFSPVAVSLSSNISYKNFRYNLYYSIRNHSFPHRRTNKLSPLSCKLFRVGTSPIRKISCH